MGGTRPRQRRITKQVWVERGDVPLARDEIVMARFRGRKGEKSSKPQRARVCSVPVGGHVHLSFTTGIEQTVPVEWVNVPKSVRTSVTTLAHPSLAGRVKRQ